MKFNVNLLVAVFLLSFLIRIVFVLNVKPPHLRYEGLFYWDAYDYCRLAQNVVSGKGYVDSDTGKPTGLRAPGQPFFLAMMYFFFGHSHTAAKLAQAFLSAITCVLIYFIAYRLCQSATIGLLSAFFFAIYPASVYYSGYLLSETLFTFFFTCSVLVLILENETNSLTMQFLSGLFLGLSALTRPVVLLFFPFIFLWKFLKKESPIKASAFSTAFITLFMLLTLLPWMVRNYAVHKAVVPVSIYAGYQLWQSSHPYPEGWGLGYVTSDTRLTEAQGVKDELERDRVYMREGIQFVLQNPVKFIKMSILKVLWFFNVFDGETYFDKYKYNLVFGLLITFCFMGVTLNFQDWRKFSILYLAIFYFLFMAIVFHGSPRYRFPIDSYMIILASSGFCNLFERHRKKAVRLTTAILFANLGLFMCGNHLKSFLKTLVDFLFG